MIFQYVIENTKPQLSFQNIHGNCRYLTVSSACNCAFVAIYAAVLVGACLDDSFTGRIISYVCVYMFNVSICKHSEMRTKCSFCVGDTIFRLSSPCDLSRATTKSIVECSTIFIRVAATKCRTRL